VRPSADFLGHVCVMLWDGGAFLEAWRTVSVWNRWLANSLLCLVVSVASSD
jgi:hypothetical protein